MTVEGTLAIKSIGDLRLSPDGHVALYTAGTTDAATGESATRLMFLAPDTGKTWAVKSAPEGAGGICWSPDGKRAAFIAAGEIWTLDAASGKVRKVAPYQRSNAFLSKAGAMLAWSPDGKQLAFAGTTESAPATPDPWVISRILYKTRTALADARRTHIYLVAASGGAPRQLTTGDTDEHSLSWGGSEIFFLSNHEPHPGLRLNYDIFAVTPGSGAIRQLTRTPGVEMDPSVSPDGRSIAYLATRRKITTIDSIAEDAHLWLLPAEGGAPRELNAAQDRRSFAPVWSADSRSILYTVADHGKLALYRVEREGGAPAALVDRDAQITNVTAASNGAVLGVMTDAVTPPEIFRLESGAPRVLTRINPGAGPTAKPETIHFTSFDGTQVEGWFYPPDHPTGHDPMILSIHGGPHEGMFGYRFNPVFSLYAARGYATLAINPRGTTGYGQTFTDGCLNNWGGGDYHDLMAGVDYILRTHPGIDAGRLGVTGASYGGFMTNWVITQTRRFKAAVAVSSLSDLISFYGTSLYQDLIEADFSGFPWEDDHYALLWKWSPLAHVAAAGTPTLFLHGEADNDVPISQAEEMYTALRRRGVAAELVRYPREGHGFHEVFHRLDATRRTLEWMDRYVKGH